MNSSTPPEEQATCPSATECPDCGGDGYSDPRETCPTCGHEARRAITCARCEGSGRVPEPVDDHGIECVCDDCQEAT